MMANKIVELFPGAGGYRKIYSEEVVDCSLGSDDRPWIIFREKNLMHSAVGVPFVVTEIVECEGARCDEGKVIDAEVVDPNDPEEAPFISG